MLRLEVEAHRVQARLSAMADAACMRIPEQGIPGAYPKAVYAWLLPRNAGHWGQVALGSAAPAPGYVQMAGDDFRGLSRPAAIARVRGIMLGVNQIRPAEEFDKGSALRARALVAMDLPDGRTARVLEAMALTASREQIEQQLPVEAQLISVVPVVLTEAELGSHEYRDQLEAWAVLPASTSLLKSRAAPTVGDGIAQLKALGESHSSRPR